MSKISKILDIGSGQTTIGQVVVVGRRADLGPPRTQKTPVSPPKKMSASQTSGPMAANPADAGPAADIGSKLTGT